jgi:hypothetical protein
MQPDALARSEKERASFLQLAKTWYEAGLSEEQSLGLISESKDLLEGLRKLRTA